MDRGAVSAYLGAENDGENDDNTRDSTGVPSRFLFNG